MSRDLRRRLDRIEAATVVARAPRADCPDCRGRPVWIELWPGDPEPDAKIGMCSTCGGDRDVHIWRDVPMPPRDVTEVNT